MEIGVRTVERERRIKEIFDAAWELQPEQRASFIAAACGADEPLRAAVLRLWQTHEQLGGFLEKPLLLAGSPPAQIRDHNGRRVGSYLLQRLIGRGGMAVVYRAVRADDYQQEVAIKLVWPLLDVEQVIHRFKQERQILADLDHPNITRLLDGGTTEDGWPYLVMEYINGEPLTDYCRTHALSLKARLEIFQIVCHAVAYAHSQRVVHRDLKPANIFVTTDGVVKLLDFGIAKVLAPKGSIDQHVLTQTGMRPMTPEYASPEQVREERITATSDVYSLGVVFYELLTGHHPQQFNKLPLHEVVRRICEEDPLPPSVRVAPAGRKTDPDGEQRRRQRQFQGDLDKIALTALQKDSRRRYQSAAQFGADIARHLQGEPILARDATWAYRASKYVKKHKATTALIALSAVLLLSLIGSLLYHH
jgi:eukaryotic-like serine/threonine-protein kinase